MSEGKKYFVCGLPYQLSIKEDLLLPDQVMDEMQEADFDMIEYQIEMECLFFGESDKAYFKFEQLNRSRLINKPCIPMTDVEYVQYKGDKRKNKFYKIKHPNEIRFLGVDIAIIGGKGNDSTVFTFIRCIPSGDHYVKSVEYIETLDGDHTSLQALRLKQVFYDLECDYCVMDTAGNGIGIYDECTKITFDTARGIEYPAWSAMNSDDMKERAFDSNAVPLIQSIKVAGQSAPYVNHEMATYTKTQFVQKSIKLLCNEQEGKEYMIDNHGLMKMSSFDFAKATAPYVHTTRLISEMINLELTVRDGRIKLVEPQGHKKDRYSSLSYCLYFIKQLESEMRIKTDDRDSFDILSEYIIGF